jgi:hypothetical protein
MRRKPSACGKGLLERRCCHEEVAPISCRLFFWCLPVAGQSKPDSVAAPQAREVPLSPGTPLFERIQPGEDTLIVRSTRNRPLEVLPPPNTSMFEWSAANASSVVVVEIIDSSPVLAKAGGWITSTIEASIIDVLKESNTRSLRAGGVFSFEQDGGEALVSGTRVRAILPWAKPFEVGHRYLLFVSVDPATKAVLVSPLAAYDISGERPVRLAPSKSGRDDIEATETVEALGRVRATAASAR